MPSIRFRTPKPPDMDADEAPVLEARSLVSQRIAAELDAVLSGFQAAGLLPQGVFRGFGVNIRTQEIIRQVSEVGRFWAGFVSENESRALGNWSVLAGQPGHRGGAGRRAVGLPPACCRKVCMRRGLDRQWQSNGAICDSLLHG